MILEVTTGRCSAYADKHCYSIFQVLSDLTRKKMYDDQLRKEESRKIFQNSNGTSRQV